MAFNRLATEDELEFLGGDDFFQPTDLGFVTSAPAVAPAVAAPPPPVFTLPSGWSTTYQSTTPRSEEATETQTSAYQFGARDEDILRSLGFTGQTLQDVTEGAGEYANTYQALTPEAQEFLRQGGYRIAARPGTGGQYFSAFDPTGKAVGETFFREDPKDDPLLNAVFAAASMAVGNVAGPGMAFLNAGRALDQGDVLGAVASAANIVPGIAGLPSDVAKTAKTVGQAAQVGRAIQREDPLGLLASGTALFGQDKIGGMPVKDVLNYGKAVQAIAKDDPIGALLAFGNTPLGKDVKLPSDISNPLSIAANLYSASQGDPRAMLNAVKTIGQEAELRAADEEPTQVSEPVPSQVSEAITEGDEELDLVPDLQPPVELPATVEELIEEMSPKQVAPPTAEELVADLMREEIPIQDLLPQPAGEPERVDVTGYRGPIEEPVLDFEQILREEPAVVTPPPALEPPPPVSAPEQRVEVTGQRLEGEPVPVPPETPAVVPDTERRINVTEGVPQTVEIVAPKAETTPLESVLNVEDILREPVVIAERPTIDQLVEAIIPPAPVAAPAPAPSPAPSPAPAPSLAPAPAAKPKEIDWLALLALLSQQQQRAPEEYRVAQIAARNPFGTIFDRGEETSLDDLLRIMRG